ncbi:MAG: glucosyl-3-phosphoglycerate synthase [Acidimicrobiales bacterium]
MTLAAPPMAHHLDFVVADLAARRQARRVSVCLPAHDEAATVGPIVATIRRHLVDGAGLVDEVLVVDDGSRDATAAVARSAGARVVASHGAGKGDALRTALLEARGELIVFCDADVRAFDPGFVVGLLGPLLGDAGENVSLVKGFYHRDYEGRPDQGGRVTELLAKPLLRALFPDLAHIAQPLGGEYAAPRHVLEQLPFVTGYGVDIGLLLDVTARFGAPAVAQVDLGSRSHRNRPLAELSPQAEAVLATVLARAGLGPAVAERAPVAFTTPSGRA